MPRRLRVPSPRIPLPTHNRRIEKVIEKKSEQETRIATRRERVNTSLAIAANIFAIPALLIGILTYTDQRASNEESDKKEAGRVNYWWEYTEGAPPKSLIIENRSLNTAMDTVIIVNSGPNRDYDYFDIGLVQPCSKVTYDLKKNGKRVDDMDNWWDIELYFKNPAGDIWSSDEDGVLKKVKQFPDLDDDYVEKWGLTWETESLDSCA